MSIRCAFCMWIFMYVRLNPEEMQNGSSPSHKAHANSLIPDVASIQHLLNHHALRTTIQALLPADTAPIQLVRKFISPVTVKRHCAHRPTSPHHPSTQIIIEHMFYNKRSRSVQLNIACEICFGRLGSCRKMEWKLKRGLYSSITHVTAEHERALTD